MSDPINDAIKGSIPKEENNQQPENIDNVNNTDEVQDNIDDKTPKEPPKAIELDINDFNEKYGKKFGREIKDSKELEEIFSAPNKIKEFEDKIKEHENAHGLTKKELDDLRAEYESKKENLQYFNIKDYVGEDLLRISEMRKKYPDKDIAVMTQINSMDLDQADNVDLLVKKALLNDSDIYKGMDDSQIKEAIAGDFGNVDLNDPSSWDNVTKAKIAKAAKEARIEFKALRDVELPVPVDIEKLKSDMISKEKQQFEQSKNQWSPIVDKMLENISSTEISFKDADGEVFKFTPKVDDAFKEEISKMRDFINEIKKRPTNGRVTVENSDWPIELYLDACRNF